ncbi:MULTISPECIES: hypothetical protein [unclassified Aureimonas]|uniref:hypothetical protein n=1 Tax=unclassified Aureimonas TaxID=2615206 RepID=UPI0006F93590|nr:MULTISPECIES: hypothetical protein [unclassified Aureimonas]KQT52231.1 hypothetical protein ASG62_16365 [Aureimonas sp. Leaf427]KQT70535.1 hypothetical protein ASG54_21585 [Aureimonas sp. Leaf460]
MSYGVTPAGFVRPTMAEILDAIEQSNVAIFGSGLIQTAASPMGQWNGLRAEQIMMSWERTEEVYQSYDPRQAEGVPLDRLAALRLLARQPGETDASLSLAITNAGVANTRDADFYRSVLNVSGVTWARIYVNDADEEDDNGMSPHSVSLAAIGGDDEALALVARRYIVPGITSFGNTRVETEIDGYCRSIMIHRPVEVPTKLELDIRKWADAGGCPPDPTSAIAATLVANLSDANRPRNGVTLTKHIMSQALCDKPNVEVVAGRGAKNAGTVAALPLAFGFNEIPLITLANVTLHVVD